MARKILVAIVLCACCCAALASNVIRIVGTKASAGNKGKFNIVVQNDVAINGMNFVVKYDPLIILPTQVTPLGRSTVLAGSSGNLYGGNRISFLLYDTGTNRPPADFGNVFEVEYSVSESVQESTTKHITFPQHF